LLEQLLDSINRLNSQPWKVIVVDNENSPVVKKLLAGRIPKSRFVYHANSENLGGAGGFNVGVRIAYELGAEWFWIMDDDVEVLPNAIDEMGPFTKRFFVVQPRRLDFDGSELYWQYRFSTRFGILSPIARKNFPSNQDYIPIQQICFEGGLIHRSIITRIGLPDARFFIYWDDVIYGYLASKITAVAYINVFALKRTRELSNLSLGARKLRASSDLTRYYIMRNRGFLWRYFEAQNDLNRLTFTFGTLLTFAKETVRILLAERASLSKRHSFLELRRGMRDARTLKLDPKWTPPHPSINFT
jgi:glycosyltransferase involved in cell wall biosynthesis